MTPASLFSIRETIIIQGVRKSLLVSPERSFSFHWSILGLQLSSLWSWDFSLWRVALRAILTSDRAVAWLIQICLNLSYAP